VLIFDGSSRRIILRIGAPGIVNLRIDCQERLHQISGAIITGTIFALREVQSPN